MICVADLSDIHAYLYLFLDVDEKLRRHFREEVFWYLRSMMNFISLV